MPDGTRDETRDATRSGLRDVDAASTRIVAVGSPFADDQAGWLAAERLTRAPAPGPFGESAAVPVIRLARPLDLLDHLTGCQRLLILDACRTGAPPGSIVRLQWPDPRIEHVVFASSHLLGLPEALRLADCLGRLPSQVVILGIELSDATGHFELSDDVRRALPELERRVREELNDKQVRPPHCPSCA